MFNELKGTFVDLKLSGEELTDVAAVIQAYLDTHEVQDLEFKASLVRALNKMKHWTNSSRLYEV